MFEYRKQGTEADAASDSDSSSDEDDSTSDSDSDSDSSSEAMPSTTSPRQKKPLPKRTKPEIIVLGESSA